ncbi:unnamed protein product [Sphagnum tenellum]
MDALVEAYREVHVHMKMAVARKKGKQLFDAMAEFLGDWVGTHRSRSPASFHMASPGLSYAVDSIEQEQRHLSSMMLQIQDRHSMHQEWNLKVCHIVLMVHEDSRFDPRLLHMFQTHQAAKHALAPFAKTQVLPGLLPAPANKPTLPPCPVSSMTSNTSGRNSHGTGQQSSTIALMSGSAPVLFPGQCTPGTLFVFLEDSPNSTATMEGSITAACTDDATDSTGLPSGSQTGSVHILRQELLSKPSNSTSVPAWPGSKPELGLCKKMQSSTEAQIFFLLKKCCTIASVAGEGGSLAAPVGTGMDHYTQRDSEK